MHMYLYMCLYVNVYTCVYMYVYMYMYVHTYISLCVYVHILMEQIFLKYHNLIFFYSIFFLFYLKFLSIVTHNVDSRSTGKLSVSSPYSTGLSYIPLYITHAFVFFTYLGEINKSLNSHVSKE